MLHFRRYRITQKIKKKMKKEEVLSNLCCYDKRYVHRWSKEDDEIQERAEETCHCDNCFYGRTKLAEYILKLLAENK